MLKAHGVYAIATPASRPVPAISLSFTEPMARTLGFFSCRIPVLARTSDELDAIRARCKAMVVRRASLSASAALLPLPGIDIGTDIAILMRLLPAINRQFGLSDEQIEKLDPETKKIVMVFVSAVGSELVGRVVTHEIVTKLLRKLGLRVATASVSRAIPFLGQAVAGCVSFGTMKMLGDAHIRDCYAVAQQAIDAASLPMAPITALRHVP